MHLPKQGIQSVIPRGIRPTWRIYLATGAFGGLVLGLNAVIIEMIHGTPNQQFDMTPTQWCFLHFTFGPLIGMILGLFASPFMVGLIVKKDLRVATPLLIGGAVAADFAASSLLPTIRSGWGGLFHAVIDVLAIALLAFVVWKWFPDAFGPFDKQHCQGCGYRLTGSSSRRCPECGRAVPLAVISLDEPIDHTK